MPITRSTFQTAEALENTWCNPPAQGDKGVQPEDWHPLPEGDYKDWVPLKEQLEMPEALRNVRNNCENVKPLSDECAGKLADLWHGRQGHASCVHETQGVAHFHCYSIDNKKHAKRPEWEMWRKHPDFTGSAIWWCSSLSNAADHWSWKHYPGGAFEQLAWALQSAMRRRTRDKKPDQTLVAVVCLKILSWGGVRDRSDQTINWLDAALTAGTLVGNLEKAASLLCPQSTANLADFFGEAYPRFPMNSGSTKLFSAVAMEFSGGLHAPKQDVLIFDRRVSTALGLIAREVSCPDPVPNQFLFPYDDDNGKKGKKNPSCLNCTQFPRMSSKKSSATSDVELAEYARAASRCIQQALSQMQPPAKQYQPSTDFISAEKALFMIGYDVQNTCSGSKRVCQSSADKAPPRPTKRQPRAPAAAAPAPAHPHERRSETLGQGVEFSYTGTPETGTDLYFGDGRKVSVSAAKYVALRAYFRDMRVAIGASRTNPPVGSLGAWLRENLSNLPAIASYVAPILTDAGWARSINNRTIEFL